MFVQWLWPAKGHCVNLHVRFTQSECTICRVSFLTWDGGKQFLFQQQQKKNHNTLNHRFNTQKLAEVMQKLAVELGLGLRNSWPVARVQSTGFHCGLPLVLMETPVPAVSTWHLLFCVL